MTLTAEQFDAFTKAARPLMQWLGENCHPHVHVVVTNTNAELAEGIAMFRTHDYVGN